MIGTGTGAGAGAGENADGTTGLLRFGGTDAMMDLLDNPAVQKMMQQVLAAPESETTPPNPAFNWPPRLPGHLPIVARPLRPKKVMRLREHHNDHSFYTSHSSLPKTHLPTSLQCDQYHLLFGLSKYHIVQNLLLYL